MQTKLKPIFGPWKCGIAMDKHSLSSTRIGEYENGQPRFETVRTPVGEAVYLLKYRSDWGQVGRLARLVVRHAVPLLGPIDLVVPMPASRARNRQPVTEVARAVAGLLGIACDAGILSKSATGQLKDLDTREEKDAALAGAFSTTPLKGGPFDALLIDDLYHTGASMHAAALALGSLAPIRSISVIALTWR